MYTHTHSVSTLHTHLISHERRNTTVRYGFRYNARRAERVRGSFEPHSHPPQINRSAVCVLLFYCGACARPPTRTPTQHGYQASLLAGKARNDAQPLSFLATETPLVPQRPALIPSRLPALKANRIQQSQLVARSHLCTNGRACQSRW